MKKTIITALAFAFALPLAFTTQSAEACPTPNVLQKRSAHMLRGRKQMRRPPHFKRRARRRMLRRDHRLMRNRAIYRRVLRKRLRHHQLKRYRKVKHQRRAHGKA